MLFNAVAVNIAIQHVNLYPVAVSLNKMYCATHQREISLVDSITHL